MESGAISVTNQVLLPSQPSGTGDVQFIPLGGDGFTAPHAAYTVRNFSSTGDATGGRVTQDIFMDPRYCSMISWVVSQIEQAIPADADCRISIDGSEQPGQVYAQNIKAAAAALGVQTISCQFSPRPFIYPGGGAPRIHTSQANVNGDEYTLDCLIYLFNIRVRETTPFGWLLAAAGGSGYSTSP